MPVTAGASVAPTACQLPFAYAATLSAPGISARLLKMPPAYKVPRESAVRA